MVDGPLDQQLRLLLRRHRIERRDFVLRQHAGGRWLLAGQRRGATGHHENAGMNRENQREREFLNQPSWA